MSESTIELPTIYPKTRANSLVPPILSPQRLKRKLSIASSGDLDDEYEPGGVDDDESSIQYEEDEKDDEEIDDLKKEGEIPIEQLMQMYGMNNSQDSVKFKMEDSQDSASDDEDGDPDRKLTMDKDDWKKEILIGPEYQAEIPSLTEKDSETDTEEKSVLLWRPDKLNPEQLSSYLSKVYALEEFPVAELHRDDEQALFILHSQNYEVDSALQQAEERHLANGCCLGQNMKPWTEEECQAFENGLKLYGKQFNLIQKNMVNSRTINEVVQFYYLWKKTERYDIFIQYYRLGSTRFIFNPGQPMDIDRSLYTCPDDLRAGVKQEEEDVKAGEEAVVKVEGAVEEVGVRITPGEAGLDEVTATETSSMSTEQSQESGDT